MLSAMTQRCCQSRDWHEGVGGECPQPRPGVPSHGSSGSARAIRAWWLLAINVHETRGGVLAHSTHLIAISSLLKVQSRADEDEG